MKAAESKEREQTGFKGLRFYLDTAELREGVRRLGDGLDDNFTVRSDRAVHGKGLLRHRGINRNFLGANVSCATQLVLASRTMSAASPNLPEEQLICLKDC